MNKHLSDLGCVTPAKTVLAKQGPGPGLQWGIFPPK